MRNFLEKCGFKVFCSIDDDLKTITSWYEQLQEIAKNCGIFNQKAIFFVYYSGHGTIERGETFGHTVKHEVIPIDKYIAELFTHVNTFTFGFFDCCRVEEISKGIPPANVNKPINGQYFILYSSEKDQPALAQGSEDMSMVTKSFLEFAQKNDVSFPYLIQ